MFVIKCSGILFQAGLQHRLAEQDSLLSQLKSEKLHIELELQAKVAENVSFLMELHVLKNSGRELHFLPNSNLMRRLL